MKAVKELLFRFRDDLEIEEIEGLDAEDFLPLCVLPAFRAMHDFSRMAVEVNEGLRSSNSELLAGLWLVSQGYGHVKVSFKDASVGKYEYDTIGVKNGQCLVLEVKGAGTIDNELQRQIGRLAEKIEHLRERLPMLAQALEYEPGIEDVSGLFVFLGDLDGFKSDHPSIPLWGHGKFVEELKSIGLPDRIVGLLKKVSHHLYRTLDDFLHDPFFAGLEE